MLLGAVAGLELVASFAVALPLLAAAVPADTAVPDDAADDESHALSGKYMGRT